MTRPRTASTALRRGRAPADASGAESAVMRGECMRRSHAGSWIVVVKSPTGCGSEVHAHDLARARGGVDGVLPRGCFPTVSGAPRHKQGDFARTAGEPGCPGVPADRFGA